MTQEQPLAVGFSDLRGFTSYTAERGDHEAFQLVQTFTELVARQVDQHGGRLLKTYGDGVMMSFEDVEEALACGAAMQEAVSGYNEAHEDAPLSAGIGLTWGTAICTGDDLFGHSVNFAKRLADVAKGGQVVVSSSVCDRTQHRDDLCFRDLGEREIKGLGTHRLYEYVWRAEVANLCLADDSLNLSLTEDDKLVLEFAKPLGEKLSAMHEKLEPQEGEAPLVAALKRRVADNLMRRIPKWLDAAERLAGLGIEHDLEDIDAAIDKGDLIVSLPTGGKLRIGKGNVDQEEARRFLTKLQSLKGSAPETK